MAKKAKGRRLGAPKKNNNDQRSFFDVITEAVDDISDKGFDSSDRVAFWSERIRKAAEKMLQPESVMKQWLRDAMSTVYRKLLDKGEIARFHPGVKRFTIESVRPQLRAELDRRIMASANLIKLNRRNSINRTLARFEGWSTSIPKGGAAPGGKADAKAGIRKALANLPFEERRVLIDQGHKLTASINEVVAKDGGALAIIWHSHWRQPGYNYRPDHKERDLKVYMLRDTWASRDGLIKAGPAGFYDKITAVAEEPFCRCYAEFIYNIRSLPDDMLTVKGKAKLADAKAKVAALRAKP